LFDAFATLLMMGMYFVALSLVFSRFTSLGGWTLGEVAFLWGTVEFAFGWMDMLFSGFDPATFGRDIRLGLFDQMLLRPLNITLQVLGREFILRRLGRIANGAVIFNLAEIEWTLGKLLYLPWVIIGLIGFFGGLFVIGATFTFWTVESIEALNILTYGGSEMMAYPMHIYPDWLRRTFTYVIPAIFLNYYPSLYFLNKPDPFGLPAMMPFMAPVVGIAILTLALAFWQFGIKHYQSTGS
jgi:ABC-2 type transport system permease protein